MKKILITLPTLFLTSLSFAEIIQCRVVGVNDANTITCLTNENKQVKVRLWGIDAPENGQDFGQKSKKTLSDLIFDDYVKIDIKNIDRYKRSVGVIYVTRLYGCCVDDKKGPCTTCEDEINVNLEMVKQGMAWWYKDYAKKNIDFLLAEREAKENKIGLWSQTNPVPPWIWRKMVIQKRKKDADQILQEYRNQNP